MIHRTDSNVAPFDADIVEIRATENGYVLTAFKTAPYDGQLGEYRTWIASRKDLGGTIDKVLDGISLQQHTAIPPARKRRSGIR